MPESDPQIFIIESYFEDIEKRITFLDELAGNGHKDEAFLLCSVYIESMANRYYQKYGSAQGFCSALIEISKNELFALIHPKQLVKILESKKLFDENIDSIKKSLEPLKDELHTYENISKLLTRIFDTEQQAWLGRYWYKGSMAMIIYERIRCQAVHDIWAAPLSFSSTQVNGKEVPNLDYNLLKVTLDEIVIFLKEASISERNLFL
jgi:hypothetical protein